MKNESPYQPQRASFAAGISGGAHVMGCLICFPCERKLLHPETTPIPRPVRLRLNRLYRERICGF